MQKTTGQTPKELVGAPTLPPQLVYLWNIFMRLYNASGGVIGYNELLAYIGLTGEELSPMEVDIIMRLSSEAQSG